MIPFPPHAAHGGPAQFGVQVRAWIVNEHAEVLLVPHGAVGMALPGGPADIAESDHGALTAHVQEQVGLSVHPIGLLATDRLLDARHTILLCARISSDTLAENGSGSHQWVKADTAKDEMPPRMYRQFCSLWRIWQEQRAAALHNGRPTRLSPPAPRAARELHHATESP
ncbi:hypothetical protein ACIOEW_40745 [Streptomyces sp. NPDC087901]|uniref:hypothetical protein n=1 Tax=Streptomyces sp. NPDC087901 TaxID=3365818 RepID=UPI0038303D42